MQWRHKDMPKIGRMVFHRTVREAFHECLGYWPTLPAPEWLTRERFVKFCWLVDNDSEGAYTQDNLPRDYVPMDFEDDPQQWAARP